jgi:mannosyltransferase
MKEQLSNDEMNITNRIRRFFLALPCNIRYFLMNLKSTVVQDNYLKILLLLTITGLILRLWHIGDVSFWLDETLTNGHSHHSFLEIWFIGMDGFNPPTFYSIEHAMLYFGSGEVVLRLVPALAGTCTIPLFYLLGREFHNRETGLAAAALLTVSSFHIYYSQEARPYTLFLFCFSLALLFYLRACKTNSDSAWVLFGIFSALSCWAHLFGFIFVLPLFLLAILAKFFTVKTGIGDLKPVILAGAIWFLISLPMLLVTVQAGLSKSKAEAVGSWGYQGIDVITTTIRDEFGGYTVGIIILCFLFLVGLVWLLHNDRKRFLFISVALAIPLMVTVVIYNMIPVLNRYQIGHHPIFFLGISYVIGSVHRRVFTIRFSCIAILLLVAISVPSLNLYYSADSKYGQDWKGFSPELHALTRTGDSILVYPDYEATSLLYYYNNRTEHTFVYGVKNKTDLEEFIRQNPDQKKMIIIVGGGNLKPTGEIGQWIGSHAVLVERHEELFLYRIK